MLVILFTTYYGCDVFAVDDEESSDISVTGVQYQLRAETTQGGLPLN